MSTFSQNATHLQPPSSPPIPNLPNLTELAALAEKLQEIVKDLLVFCQQSQQAESPGVEPDSEDADKNAEQKKAPCETRCYQIPGNILDEERGMLEFYKAENWQELFNKAHDQIYATVLLMERIPAEEEIDGFSITLVAENLMRPLRMLSKLCSLIADFRLVHMMKADV